MRPASHRSCRDVRRDRVRVDAAPADVRSFVGQPADDRVRFGRRRFRPRRLGRRHATPGLGGHQHFTQGLDLFAQLHEGDDAWSMLLAPEEHPLAEDVHRDDALGAPRGREGLSLLGEAPAGGDIELVLVLEAAEQATASARDLAGVEGEMLVLGEPQVDRRKLLEPRRAAVLAAAASDAGQPRGLVADADLPELDAGAEQRGEVPDEGAEVDALLRGEVDGELVPIPLPFGVAHLHHQVVRAHALDHLPAGVVLGATILVVHPHVVARGAPDHRLGRRGLRRGGLAADRAPRAAAAALLRGHVTHRGDPAEVAAALDLDQDRLADAERRPRRPTRRSTPFGCP